MRILTLTTLVIPAVLWQPLAANTLLIGGILRNGNFEATAAGGLDDGDRSFDDTDVWFNVTAGYDQAMQATRNTPTGLDSTGKYTGASGGYNAVVSDSNNRWCGNDTGHTVAPGDLFEVAYYWIDAFNWIDASDQIALVFFTTTDDLIDGTVEDSFEFLSGVSAADTSYQQFSQAGISLPPGFLGDTLFVQFHGRDGSGIGTGFARVDDFSLSVTGVPEPSAGLLAALAGLALLRRRR